MTTNPADTLDRIQLLVDEFDKFIKFVEEENPELSSKKTNLGKKDAFKLNSMLQNKREVSAPNYIQEQYPMVDLLFSLAVDGGLYVVGNDEKNAIILQKTPRLGEYFELNVYEKYVFLLLTYWTAYNFKSKSFMPTVGIVKDTLGESILNILSNAKAGERITKDRHPIMYKFFSCYAAFLYHLSYFGFCDVELIEGVQFSYEERVRAIIPSRLGVTASALLEKATLEYCRRNEIPSSELFFEERNELEEIEGTEDYFFNYLQKAFPEDYVEKTVKADLNIDRSGVYTFKVSLSGNKKIWRKIRLSHRHDLDTLHMAIQEAFDFDNDHLYAFYLGGGSPRHATPIYCPYMIEESELTVLDFAIEDLGLVKGQRFYYLFDFGDSWWFDVLLTDIDKNSPLPEKAEIISWKGESPKQYVFWE